MNFGKICNRICKTLLLKKEGAMFLNENKHLSKYEIGDWTHGHLDVRTWPKCGNLKVGRFCSFAPGVTILLGGEHRTDWVSSYAFPTIFPEAKDYPGWPRLKGDVIIGNDVWIGQGAIILSGLTIGDGAVVGARSVVRRDVPAYGVVAGNPAIFTGYRFDKSLIDDLLEIAWWNWPIEKIEEAWNFMLTGDIKKFVEHYKKTTI